MEAPNAPNAGAQPPSAEQAAHPGHDALEYIRQNIQAVAITGGLAILAAVIVVAYITQQRRSSETAAQMLALAESPKQLEELLAQYPSSAAAPIAMLALASGQYAAGAYDQAVINYVRFVQQYPKHPMAAVAELGKLMCFEGRGEVEQALAGFTAFIAAHPDHFLLPQALMGKARCLQATQRTAEAKAVYEDFIAAHPDSDWKPQMEMALRFMERDQRAGQAGSTPPPVAAPSPAPWANLGAPTTDGQR